MKKPFKFTDKDLNNPDYVWIDESNNGALQQAISAGAARSLIEHEEFFLNKSTVNDITIASKKGSTVMRAPFQIAQYRKLWEDPFMLPYVLCISSMPSEIMAQMLAMRLFLRATSIAQKLKKSQPLWHPIYGGIRRDKLRDPDSRDPSIPFLVLSNVADNATPYKFEKLRDIITMYNHIPRVIVTSSCDPVEFMNDGLKMPINFAMWLGAKREKRFES